MMPHITLDDDQARIVTESPGPVELRDRAGNRLARVWPDVPAEDVAIAKERLRSSQPRYTTRQILEHLQSMQKS